MASPRNNGLTPFFDCGLITDGRQRQQFMIKSTFERHAGVVPAIGIEDAERLLANGFVPRTDGFFERNMCPSCNVCVPIRIPLELFARSNEHRRIAAKNARMTVTYGHGMPNLRVEGPNNPVVKLLMDYSAWRFPDRLKPEKDDQGRSLVFSPHTYLNGFRNLGGLQPQWVKVSDPETGKLVGCIICNVGKESAYGSVFFYDPAYRKQSMGHFLVLSEIERLKIESPEIRHLYLANWSTRDTDYSWKIKYPPVEMMLNGKWSHPMFMPEIRQLRDIGKAFPAKRGFTLNT